MGIIDIILEFFKKLSEVSFTVMGFKIYLNLIIIVFAIVIAFSLVLGILTKLRSKKRVKEELNLYDAYCQITPFQRDAITHFIKETNTKKENGYLLKYMENNRVWYTDEILDKDPGIMIRINNIIFSEVIEVIRNNSLDMQYAGYAFRLIHMMDAMNGGPRIIKHEYAPWICDEISTAEDYNVRAQLIMVNALKYFKDVTGMDENLIKAAAEEIKENNSAVFNYTDGTKVLLEVALVRYIQDTFMKLDLEDISQSYIRVLASVLVKKAYPAAINQFVVFSN